MSWFVALTYVLWLVVSPSTICYSCHSLLLHPHLPVRHIHYYPLSSTHASWPAVPPLFATWAAVCCYSTDRLCITACCSPHRPLMCHGLLFPPLFTACITVCCSPADHLHITACCSPSRPLTCHGLLFPLLIAVHITVHCSPTECLCIMACCSPHRPLMCHGLLFPCCLLFASRFAVTPVVCSCHSLPFPLYSCHSSCYPCGSLTHHILLLPPHMGSLLPMAGLPLINTTFSWLCISHFYHHPNIGWLLMSVYE